jgi:ketosteroid isomerase-like protein
MMRDSRAVTAWCVLAACLLVALGGCADRSVGPDGPTYPDQSTPDHVMEKLVQAYEAMDAGAYLECLAEDFVFFLNPEDVASDPGLPEYWDRAEEQVVAGLMFADTTSIEDVRLTLTVVSADSLPGEDPDDPADDLWEYVVEADLRLRANFTWLADGLSRFVLRRSPGQDDVVWQIIEHRDLDYKLRRREESTWTEIKLAFADVQASLYPVRSSPENVLRKLNLAYERMDAEAYLDCLGEDFLFFLNPDDVDEDPEHPLPESWNRAEEETIHGNMFGEDTDVRAVSLVLDHVESGHDPGDPEDPSDDVWTYLEHYDLRVLLPPNLTLLADSRSEFVFQVDPDEIGHGGIALWEITSWSDGPGLDSLTEDSSWGRIKSMYR